MKDLAVRAISEIVDHEIEDFLSLSETFARNPMHWPNNMRRLHGLGPLRKESNYKGRTEWHSYLLGYTLCKVDHLMNKAAGGLISQTIRQMADAKEVHTASEAKYEP